MVSHGELSQIAGRMQLRYQAEPHRQLVTSVVVSYFDLVTCGTDVYDVGLAIMRQCLCMCERGLCSKFVVKLHYYSLNATRILV